MSEADEIAALRDSFRAVLQQKCTLEAVMRHYDGDDLGIPLWNIVAELGWTALSVPEGSGGLGLGFAALCALYRELGRSLAPLPLLPTLLVVDALTQGGDAAQQAEWLPALAEGSVRATLTQPRFGAAVGMRRSGGDIVLQGTATALIDLDHAALALILVEDENGTVGRVLVDLVQDGVQPSIVQTTDQTRSLGHLQFAGLILPAGRLLARAQCGAALENALARHAAIAIACDALGGAEAIFEIVIDYLKVREQFGRPIGSFQALKHRCADHKTSLVVAGALLDEIVATADRGKITDLDACSLKALCSLVYAEVAQDAVQLHGGIGFTWEHVCHLFLKRAKMNEVLFGTTERHLDLVAASLAA